MEDLLPGGGCISERRLLRHALDSDALTFLLRQPAFTEAAAMQAVGMLQRDIYVGEEAARFVVRCVITARGGDPKILNVTMPEPSEPVPESPEPVPVPAARTGQGGFRNKSGLLWVYVLICLAAAVALVVLAQIITWTVRSLIGFVPGMLLSAVFYVVSAIFISRCRRKIREMSDAGLADSVRRTAISFGTLILIHILVTALHQYILWFSSYIYERVPVAFLILALCAVSAVFVFRYIRKMLDGGPADSVRRTVLFGGTLILIRVVLSVIEFTLWFVFSFYVSGWI